MPAEISKCGTVQITIEKDWDVHREVKGWGLREWLVLLTYDDVSENDLNDGRNP